MAGGFMEAWRGIPGLPASGSSLKPVFLLLLFAYVGAQFVPTSIFTDCAVCAQEHAVPHILVC